MGINRIKLQNGSPLEMAKAQEEARNRASLLAIQQAQAEQAQDARLGTQLLGAAYLPEAQAQNALQRGLLASQLAQRGQLYGTGLFGEASIAGLDALLGSGIGQAELVGRISTGLLSGALGEDYAFCDRWTSIGGKIYANVDAYITHHGDFAYRGRFIDEGRKIK